MTRRGASRQGGKASGRRRWIPLLVLGFGAMLIGWLLIIYRPAPIVPRDRDHNNSTVPDGCLECHGPAGSSPRQPNHPINEACFSCHRWP